MQILKRNSDKKVGFHGLIETAGSDFGDFRIDYHEEYEDICETALARESRP
jgi:hypothetical protein